MVQEKNEKIMEEIKKQQRDLFINIIKDKWQQILMTLICVIGFPIYLYVIPIAYESSRPIWVLFAIFLGVIFAYLTFLEEVIFKNSFFQMEKNYYIWENLKKESYEREIASYNFQSSFFIFYRKLSSKVTGFERSNILFKRDIFDFRITKVKKEIDIFFNLIIDLIFKEEFHKQIDVKASGEPYSNLNDFFNNFKNVFIKTPGSMNLIALDNFFIIFNEYLKNKYEKTYDEIEKEVNEYYTKHEKLIEQRSERKSELIRSTVAFLFAFMVAFITAKFLL